MDPHKIPDPVFREIKLDAPGFQLDLQIPETVKPLLTADEEAPSLGDRIKTLWSVVRVVAEDVVVVVERIATSESGKQKKKIAVQTVLDWLKQVEGKFDWIPSWMESIVFYGLKLALGIIVERAFGNMLALGEVNKGH